MKEILNNSKKERSWVKWTEEEDLFLEKNFGILSLHKIAEKLNRRVGAVEVRKYSLRLGPSKDVNGKITVFALAKILKVSEQTVKGYIKKRGLPARKKILYKSKQFTFIDIEEFWKWLEKNKDINVTKIESRSLGKEPKWLKERKNQQIKENKKGYEYWTLTQIEYLKGNYKSKTDKEIAEYIGKTESSVENRRKRLKLKKAINLKWQDIEVEMLKNYIKEGKGPTFIAEELGRSVESVKHKISYSKKKGFFNG